MVATLVGLKLRLLRNGLRTSVWKLIGLIIGGVYGLGIVLMIWGGSVALRSTPVALRGDVTTLAFSAATIGWLLRFVATNDFKPFAVYRVIVGVIILVMVQLGLLA